MMLRDIAGIAVAIIVLAGISVAIKNGGDTAKVINSFGTAFQGTIKAATIQG